MIGRVLVLLAVLLRLPSAERTSVRLEQNFRRAVDSYLGVSRSRVRRNDPLDLAEAAVLPGACPDGILQLSGKYKVTNATTIPGPCQVMGRGELYLAAPVTIRGDSSFLGQVAVKATRQTERSYFATMDGPCLTITGSFILHPGARLHFESCRNGHNTSEGALGGGLRVDADMDLRGGHLRFDNCRADGDKSKTGAGGAIYVRGELRQKNSTIEACNCSATKGGTLRATKMEISGGLISINSSLSILAGGAISAEEQLVMLGGRVAITNSESSGPAGAIFAENLRMSDGSIIIQNASARGGGAMMVISQAMSGGTITIQHSRSFADGGSMDVDELDLSGGNLAIDTSRAEEKGRGGALFVRMLRVSGGGLTVYDADAESDGGCFWTDGFVHSAGKVNLTLCNSAMLGGALWTNTWNKTAAAQLTIQDAQAARGAGILASYGAHVHTKDLQMSDLSARGDGGCFLTWGRLLFNGTLSLQNCRAKGSGGAIFAEKGPPKGARRSVIRIGEEVLVEASRIVCVGCAAPAASVLQLESGHAALAAVQIRSGRASMSSMVAGPYATIEVGTLDCAESPGCAISAVSSGVGRLICRRGEGREDLDEGIRCRMCPDGQTRLAKSPEGESQCTECPKIPDMDIRCTSTELGLPPGWMVNLNLTDASNLSSWFRCPSEVACPGGHLRASAQDQREPHEVVPMCEKGYEGPGCARCSHGFARGDSNVLQCVQCANGQVFRHVVFGLLKDLALFASAAVSVAGAKGKRTSSATLLNQLMSFAAVAGITMSGAMQAPIFQHDMEKSTQEVLALWEEVLSYLCLPVAFAQGQTPGEAGASWECLLGSLGLQPTLQRAHILASVWPVILIAGLAMAKGGRLALVVGVNVFLPAFLAGFGRYLVVFRLRPEGTPLGELRWEFLPAGPESAPPQVAAVSAAIALFLALGVGSWVSVVRHRKEPLEPHVAYLTQAYRPPCAAWEVERLVRKVFLALITAMLPVTLSPALQMETVNLVLTVSLVAHLICWPYQVNAWNRVEVGLLIVALTMMGLTTSLLANALHWSKSTATQRFLVFLICSLAGGISTVMIAAFLATYAQERRSSRKESEDV